MYKDHQDKILKAETRVHIMKHKQNLLIKEIEQGDAKLAQSKRNLQCVQEDLDLKLKKYLKD